MTTDLKHASEWLESTVAGSISMSSGDHKVITAHQSENAADVIRAMLEHHYHCIPITLGGTASANRIINFITLTDVVAGGFALCGNSPV